MMATKGIIPFSFSLGKVGSRDILDGLNPSELPKSSTLLYLLSISHLHSGISRRSFFPLSIPVDHLCGVHEER